MIRKSNNGPMRETLRRYNSQLLKSWKLSTPAMVLPGIGHLLNSYAPPLIIAKLVSDHQSGEELTGSRILAYSILLFATMMAGEILVRIGFLFNHRVTLKAQRELGAEIISDIQSRDNQFFTNNFVGSITKRAGDFRANFENYIDKISWFGMPFIIALVANIVVLSRYSIYLAIYVIAMSLIMSAIGYRLVKERTPMIKARNEARAKATGYLSDIVTNMPTVKSYANEQNESANFNRHYGQELSLSFKAWEHWNNRVESSGMLLQSFTSAVGMLIILSVGGSNLDIPAVIIAFSYLRSLTNLTRNIGPNYRGLEDSISKASEHVAYMQEKPLIEDSPHAKSIKTRKKGAAISFNNVSFHYSDTTEDDKVFTSLSLNITKGESVGLVGMSGSGKTTITKLLLRFDDPQSGSITIDDQDIKDVTQESLRKAITYVPQEPLLFHRSLAENIAYGKPDATKRQIIAAAKKAHAHEFIDSLNEGYDTLVGERGIKLSGGQRQRIAIARAILKEAPILLLDEATSALDSESEAYIQEALFKLMEGRTSVVIAHRLSTIQKLDRIIVLDKGVVVEDGPHDELIQRKGGIYASLWDRQTGGHLES